MKRFSLFSLLAGGIISAAGSLSASPIALPPNFATSSMPNTLQLPFNNKPQPYAPAGYSQMPSSLNQVPQYTAPQTTQQNQSTSNGGFDIPKSPAIPQNPAIPGVSQGNAKLPAIPQPTVPTPAVPAPVTPQQPQQKSDDIGNVSDSLSKIAGEIFKSEEKGQREKRMAEEKIKERQLEEELQNKIEYMENKNYRTETLPRLIYKKRYSEKNQHLPKAVYANDYDNLLFVTIGNGDTNALRAVIGQGRSLEVRNYDGDTPLIYVAAMGDMAAARLLLAHGADPDAQSLRGGTTALQIAAFSGNEELTRLLLEMNARPGIKNAYGKTAVQIAEGRSNYGIALLLLERASELAFAENLEKIKRFHRREEDLKERELSETGIAESIKPEKKKQLAENISVQKAKSHSQKKTEVAVQPEKEQSIKERITSFLARLVSREKEQEEQVKQKRRRENAQEEEVFAENPVAPNEPETTAVPPSIMPQVPAPENLQEPGKTAVAAPEPAMPKPMFKRSAAESPKFFIPDTLFPVTSMVGAPQFSDILPNEQALEKLPGESEALPKSLPKIDLSEVISSMKDRPENGPPPVTNAASPIIIAPETVPAPVLASPQTSPGFPLRDANPQLTGESPPPIAPPPTIERPQTLEPAQQSLPPNNGNNVMIPNQPGITNPVGETPPAAVSPAQ